MKLLKIKYHLSAIIKKLLLKVIFGKKVFFGKKSTFRKGFNLSIEGNGKVNIGKNVFFNNYCSVNALCKIEIGDNTIFGENIKIYDHNHRFSSSGKKIMEQGYNMAPVIIGKDCWISSNVVILKGVTIGDNVIIGAGCIVKEDIPSNVIVKNDGKLICEERRG